ncbi:serpin family protein [Nitrosopumilus ureiphilus]|uniref:serpin family protein n=1 Tax=Nitrosopumilus ureiphilus TaxID=1470067 RepID=UPI0015C78102|nr:serpin family protein [Nitrosopumilus ureiphilus]
MLVFTLLTPNAFAESDITNTQETKGGFHEGIVEWVSRCNMTGSDITIRITDYDMNRDHEKIEQFNINIWSDFDVESDFENRVIDYIVTETGKDTGIFESNVFFTTTDSSPGKRIRTIDNSIVFAKYVDYTLPNSDKIDVVDTFVMSGLAVLERNDDGIISKIIYDPCALELFDKNMDRFNQMDVFYPAPLKQIKSGLYSFEIKCKNELELILKYSNNFPACVTPESAIALYERGWTLTRHIAVNQEAPTVYLGPTDIPSANNQFALNFYSHVTQDKESNVFFSPTSIFNAFAIAYEGAKDNTATEMKEVFGFESDESKRRIGFADMQKQLNMKQQNNTISLANALWVAKNFEVLPEYVDTAKTYYGSEIESVNFSSKEKGVDIINSWVDEKTHGKIEKIFDELDPATKLVITNAIYFKGIWEDPFDKTKTTVGDFHVSLDNTVQVPMMESKTTFPNIAVNDLVQIVELPYEGENFSMLILLSRDVDGMNSLEESLSVDNLNKWKGELQKMKTKVYMPKFKLETEYDLKSVLQEMGIHDAFNNADFTGIANSGLYIEKAAHKAFVEINEEGTEAAAATGIAMLQSGPFEFMVDRPFIFIIQDNETGSILFIGKVVDPLQ